MITYNIRPLYANTRDALRNAFFQVGAIITTTGYSTADFDMWHALSQKNLVTLMIVASVPLYNIFSVLVLTVTAPDAQQADHRGLVGKTLRGIITNPIILGIFAGLPFSLLAIDFPPMLD